MLIKLNTRDNPGFLTSTKQLIHRKITSDKHFPEMKGLRILHRNSGKIIEFPDQIMGVGYAALRHALYSVAAQGGHVGDCPDGHESLVRTDIAGGLLPADMLLPGAQGQYKAPAILVVGGFTGKASGHFAYQFAPHREYAR
jgi:hypothetical protein